MAQDDKIHGTQILIHNRYFISRVLELAAFPATERTMSYMLVDVDLPDITLVYTVVDSKHVYAPLITFTLDSADLRRATRVEIIHVHDHEFNGMLRWMTDVEMTTRPAPGRHAEREGTPKMTYREAAYLKNGLHDLVIRFARKTFRHAPK